MVESARQKAPDAFLFALISCYGGELAAVCDRISIARWTSD